MSLVDCHFHVWEQKYLPWLTGPTLPRIFGEYEPIRRDYPMEEFLEDAGSAGVGKTVYVQPNWAPGTGVDEAVWIQEVIVRTGAPDAVVLPADLTLEDAGEVMWRQAEVCNRVRGCRQQLHWHENPQYRYAPVPDQMNDATFRRNLGKVADMGWLFELQVFSGQTENTLKLVRDFPSLQFVLLHAGMLEDKAPETVARWEDMLRRLADCPNVVTKLSGLGTFVHKVDEALISRVVDQCMSTFGPERSMFGSNFPIEKLWTDYATLHAAHEKALAGYPEESRRLVLGGTAERVYAI